MKVFEKLTLLFGAATVLAGCQQVPDYASAPSISLKEVTKTVQTQNNVPVDRIDFTLNFTDGDGDLGLNTSGPDTLAPFNYSNADTIINGQPQPIINPNYHNWFTTFYIKQNGEFVPYTFPQYGFSFNLRFPRLVADEKQGPIDGTMTYYILAFHAFFPPNTEAKFDIQVQDRALNRSNRIETGVIILNEQ